MKLLRQPLLRVLFFILGLIYQDMLENECGIRCVPRPVLNCGAGASCSREAVCNFKHHSNEQGF